MLSHNNEWKTSNDNNNNDWGKTKLKLKTFFGGFHKQKELLDSDYESKTSIELYKHKRYIMAAGYNHHFQAYFLGGLVYIWPCSTSCK